MKNFQNAPHLAVKPRCTSKSNLGLSWWHTCRQESSSMPQWREWLFFVPVFAPSHIHRKVLRLVGPSPPYYRERMFGCQRSIWSNMMVMRVCEGLGKRKTWFHSTCSIVCSTYCTQWGLKNTSRKDPPQVSSRRKRESQKRPITIVVREVCFAVISTRRHPW